VARPDRSDTRVKALDPLALTLRRGVCDEAAARRIGKQDARLALLEPQAPAPGGGSSTTVPSPLSKSNKSQPPADIMTASAHARATAPRSAAYFQPATSLILATRRIAVLLPMLAAP